MIYYFLVFDGRDKTGEPQPCLSVLIPESQIPTIGVATIHTYIKTDAYMNIDTVHNTSVYQRWGLELETWSRVVVNLLTQ